MPSSFVRLWAHCRGELWRVKRPFKSWLRDFSRFFFAFFEMCQTSRQFFLRGVGTSAEFCVWLGSSHCGEGPRTEIYSNIRSGF